MIVDKILRNRYKIARQISSGGFGVTYLAEDADLPGKPLCVVKHFKPRSSDLSALPIAKSLFDKEAAILYKLGQLHNQIPQLFAHFEENGEFYLVQEFVDGHTLSSEIYRDKLLSEVEVTYILLDILEVLAVVHEHGVIHRDIKPPNLMRRHRDGKIVLIDFGAVKEISTLKIDEHGQTSVTVGIGSSGYMPDEQANGKPKLCSDIYAVGMLGIQALTGVSPSQLPEDADTGEIIWRDRVQVSDRLAEVINSMVKPHFSQRYRSAKEALQELLLSVGDSLPPRPSPLVLSTTPQYLEPAGDEDLTAIEIPMPDALTIVDLPNSDDSITQVEMEIPSSIAISGSSSGSNYSATAIAASINRSKASVLTGARASISKLSPQIVILGIGGIGLAISSVLILLNFSSFSTPNRTGSAPGAPPPKATNPPKVQPIPSPKNLKGKIFLQQGKVVYEGDLVDGKPSGKGKIKAKTYQCEGDFFNGELNGRGFCKYTNGDRYEGEFRKDKLHGKGVIKYANGSRYEGEFRNDNLDGEGILIQKNGDRVKGIWKDGQLIERISN